MPYYVLYDVQDCETFVANVKRIVEVHKSMDVTE